MNSAAINFCAVAFAPSDQNRCHVSRFAHTICFPKRAVCVNGAVRGMATSADGIIATNRRDYDQLRSVTSKSLARIPISSNITVHNVSTADRQRTANSWALTALTLLSFLLFNESKGRTLLEAGTTR